MFRRFFAALLAVCAVSFLAGVLAGPAQSAPQQYDLWVLQPFQSEGGIYESYAWDVNDFASVCGTATSNGTYVGFVRLAGDDTRQFTASWLRGINAAGKVTGHNLLIDAVTGTQTIIPRVSDYYYLVWALAVNDNDVVVGYAAWHNNEEGLNQTGFVWDAVNGTRGTNVPGLNEFVAINNANVAVGNIRPSVGSSEGLVYKVDTGEAINLDDLLTPVLGAPGYSEAHHINNAGVVAGEGWNGSIYAAFTWSEAAGFAFLPGLKGGDADRVHATGISDDNLVVGYALTAGEGWRAFAWDAVDGMRDLNDYILAPSNFICSRALRTSPNGTIVGDGYFSAGGQQFGAPRAFLLVPRDFTITGVGDTPDAISPELTAYPNPFNPQTTISYTVPQSGPVRVDIYAVTGELVTTLVNGIAPAGPSTASWNSRDTNGRAVSSGVYLVRLATPGFSATRKIVLLK